MRVVVFLVVISLVLAQEACPTAPSSPQDRRTDKSKLTITTFNAEWLFYGDRSNCPGTGCPWANDAEALAHLEKIADVISQLDSDIVTIVEVENCEVLKMVVDRVGSKYKPYLVKGTDSATGQNVGIITKIDPSSDMKRTEARVSYPVAGTKCGSSPSGNTGVSKHFYTTFNVQGLARPLVLVGIHLLAFPDQNDRCLQREAQATVISNLVYDEAISKGNYVVILGDFNDFDSTVADPAGSKPISRVLNILKSPGGSVTLYNGNAAVPSTADRWSCWYDKDGNCKTVNTDEESLIDHILMSPELKAKLSSTRIGHNYYQPMCDSSYSDHWPITITISTSSLMASEAPLEEPKQEEHQQQEHQQEVPQKDDAISPGLIAGITLGSVLVIVAVIAIYWGVQKIVAPRGETSPLIRQ